jgi:hypothetical protein
MVALCLTALAGDRHKDAALTLRVVTEEQLTGGGLKA